MPFRTPFILSVALMTPLLGSAATQTITFDAIANQIFGIAPFQITAKASAGLPVGFTSTTPTVCKTASALVQLLSTGFCNITASQAGNSSFSAAAPVSRGFSVNQAGPSGTLTQSSGSPVALAPPDVGVSAAQSITTGDFNGDGIPDFATANAGGTVSILLGNGSGGFSNAAGSPYVVGTNPTSIVTGDFNGDGFQDLAVSNFISATVTVLLGNGSGTFQQPAGSPFTVGPEPYSIAVGDFNGDGIQDLVATTVGSTTSAVTVLLGNGHGGFSAAGNFSVGAVPRAVVVADFNGDGIEDIATANNFDGTVSVLLGNGSGGFTPAPGSDFALTANPRSANPIAISAGDFNLDGVPDLAVANQEANTVSVLIGNGSGSFAPAAGSPFTVGANAADEPSALVVGDFNGDTFPDIAVANYTLAGSVTVLVGNGLGGFTSSAFPVGPLPNAIAIADFNGDGIEDLAAASFGGINVTVLLGGTAQTNSVLSTTSPLTVASGQSVPLTLTVSDPTGGFDLPTGMATFKDGSVVVGTSQGTSPYTFTAVGLAVGSHVLTASYSGDSRSAGSSSNSIKIQITVGLTAQSILFEPPGNQTYGVTPAPLSTSATSGLAVVLTSNTPAICIVSGATLSLIAPGTCSIAASQQGNANFAPAIPVTQNFTVNQGMQTIVFAPLSAILTTSFSNLMATSTSGLPVSYMSSTPSICTVTAPAFLIPVAAGTCIITASQAGNVDYLAAAPVTQSSPIVTSAASVGTLTRSSLNIVLVASFGGAPVTNTATLTYKTSVPGVPSFVSTITEGSAWLSISPSSGPLTQTSFVNSIYTWSATITFTANPVFAHPLGDNGTVVFGVNGAVTDIVPILEIGSQLTPQATGGIANAASASQAPPSVVAPGSYIAIYGAALAGNGNPAATTLPLPTTLNGTSITLGGLPMPLLYASARQVNALVPQGLQPNVSYPLVVSTGYMKSPPVTLSITELQPGIYTLDTSGSGPGIVANAATGQLIGASNPAHAGDYLVVYCTGLGPVLGQNGEAPPADGATVPTTTVYWTTGSVTATIGGVSAPVSFSGLTATLVGLYQVNVLVPTGVSPGNVVPLVITATDAQTGATAQSNSVTIVAQ